MFKYMDTNKKAGIIIGIIDILCWILIIILYNKYNLTNLGKCIAISIIVGLIGVLCLFFLDKLFDLEQKMYAKGSQGPSDFRLLTGTVGTYIVALVPIAFAVVFLIASFH